MFAHKKFSSTARAAIFATVAAVAISAVAPTAVMAAPAAKQGVTTQGVSNATDFSSQRRRHYSRRGNGNAAGLAAFAGIVGTIGAIAATQHRRDYYYDHGPGYYRGGGPGYYGGGPAYYGGGPGYYGY
jgi:ABC-type Fe3+ transport system permease subunit